MLIEQDNIMSDINNIYGNIYLAHRAIATIASQSALESYGVVGLSAKNLVNGIAQILIKDPTLGVEVDYDGKSVQIDVYVIIEYGTRVKSVATSVAENIQYQIEKSTGLTVSNVNVHVRGLRISNPD
jgi:uncharacterized alkaline shock family protein YloU